LGGYKIAGKGVYF